MLSDLHVRNLAVLEDVALELGPGLNVLTGETGAGKSIVVDALALLAGARASGELRDRRQPPADVRTRSPITRDDATHHELVVVCDAGSLCAPAGGGIVTHVEQRLDLGAVGAASKHLRSCTRTEHEFERVHEDRLAGAGLAGQHVHAGFEHELEFLDDREATDAQT